MKKYINTKNYFLLFSILMAATLGACKKNEENLSAPAKITLVSARVIDTVGVDVDQTFPAPAAIAVNPTATVIMNYEITSEADLQQTDVKIFGLTGSASYLNSSNSGKSISGYLAVREGFQTSKTDKFSVSLPGITDKTSVIIQVFNKYDLTSSKTFTITIK